MKIKEDNKLKLIISIVIIGFFILSFFCCLGSCFADDTKATKEDFEKEDFDIELETEKPTVKPTVKSTVKSTVRKLKEYTFSNGNYISGKHFKPGIYNIIAIKGKGNVISSNSWNGGINAIMGPQDDGFYQKEYKNISLPAKIRLEIKDVTIKLKEIE